MYIMLKKNMIVLSKYCIIVPKENTHKIQDLLPSTLKSFHSSCSVS